MEENTKEMIVIDSVDRYNEIFGLETRHPLVSIIDLAKSTTWPTRAWFRYEVYALYLKNVKCGDIKYGRQYYDYQDGTIVRFEHLLNEYFEGDAPQNQGLPSVKYFADKVFLSANYFGDMVRKQTGKTVSEYIQDKMIELAKEQLMSSNKTMSQIAYEIGFQYPQHLSRMFKRIVGMTPNQFRLTGYCR